jgi:hypothetical protein
VAVISPAGAATALAPGSAAITATLGGASGQAVLTIGPAVLESIAVTPASPSLAAGANELVAAIGTFSDGSTQDLSGRVAWTSAQPGVASVSAAGVASGLAPGSAAISARLGSISGVTVLTVSVSTAPAPPTPAPPVTPAPSNPQFVASGLTLRERVARFVQAIVANFQEPQAKRGQFSAIIDWGDQSATTPGHIQSSRRGKGKFSVVGSHRYAVTGTFTVTVTIHDAAGGTIASHSLVHVVK